MTTPASTRQDVTQLLGEWSGGAEDVLLLRVPMSIALHGRLGEKLSARLTGGALSLLEIYPAVDLRFEEP